MLRDTAKVEMEKHRYSQDIVIPICGLLEIWRKQSYDRSSASLCSTSRNTEIEWSRKEIQTFRRKEIDLTVKD